MYFSDLVDSIVLMDSTDCAGMRDSAELTDSMYRANEELAELRNCAE